MTNEDKFQLTMERFLASEEGQEWQDFTDALDQLDTDPDAQMITLPTAFLRRHKADLKIDPFMLPLMREARNREAAEMEKEQGREV